ncbi:hypothetical protein B7988_14500 [Fibrobacter sp. UWB1]|uniref:FISUMP domain-containing protein n=1 Tax=Fibrobacter sp. UWB1 TaxID=1964355 RepID=UPI000B6ECB52|nr:FISUMP domain-containing protein [Fibrobacter sp. UWB1]OWV24061.1 hypothetical protein B7988_14500 [Fibrobacter sp. UWB1]
MRHVIANSSVILSGTKWSRRIFIGVLFAVLCFFTACDSGSSSTDPDSIAEVSSSSDDDAISSSSVTDKETSSGGSSKSSSSEKSGNDSQKSSSSVSGKNSSSSEDESSSSEGCPFNGRNEDGSANLTVNCCNGDTAIVMSGKYTQYYTCRDDFWLRDSIGGQDTVKPYISHPNMEKQFSSKIDYETFVDDRDGQEYKIVTIKKHFDGAGDGVDEEYTFFAENLNYGKQIMANATEFSDSVVEKVCYNDDEWFCDNGFGGLYTWSEAMNIPKKYDTVAVEKLDTTYFDNGKYIDQHIQGICPKGWHIMEENEWRFLGGGAMVNSRAVWNGQDYYGFSLLPVGYSFQGKFYGYGEFARAWLPALSKKRDDMGRTVLTSDTDAYTLYDTGLERYGYQPIRCTKDY